MRRAIFLDRDGTLVREVHHLHKIEDLRLLPGVANALRRAKDQGFELILITNQSVVAHGLLSEEGLRDVHDVMLARISRQGGRVDAIYYCPHHPRAKLPKYRVLCTCRKPHPGLLRLAARELKLDLKKSFTIGDKTGDILAGKKAGTRTILVRTGYGGMDGEHEVYPDFTAQNLPRAIELIMKLK